MSDCTERHTLTQAHYLDGEGQKGMPKEAQP
jgi:hypothetical protein